MVSYLNMVSYLFMVSYIRFWRFYSPYSWYSLRSSGDPFTLYCREWLTQPARQTEMERKQKDDIYIYGGFLKWWYPTTMGFPTKKDHFGVFGGYHYLRKHPYLYYCMYCGMPTLNFSSERGMPTVWTWVFCPAASRLRGGEEVLKLLQHVGFPKQLTSFQHFGYLLPVFLESLLKTKKSDLCMMIS